MDPDERAKWEKLFTDPDFVAEYVLLKESEWEGEQECPEYD